jgi:biotin operon repressor
VSADRGLPPSFARSGLFERMGGDAVKLYLWLRARARVERDPVAGATYLVVEATGAEIERAIGVSKNTITKLARELQDLGIATFQGGRTGYRFRVGETLTRPAEVEGLTLAAEVFYLDARLAAASSQEEHRQEERRGA